MTFTTFWKISLHLDLWMQAHHKHIVVGPLWDSLTQM